MDINLSTEAFALAMQRPLTKAEVAEAYLANVRHVIDADAVGMYQLHANTGQVVDSRVTSTAGFLDAYEQYGRADDPVLEHVITHRTAVDSSRLPVRRWSRCGARQALGIAGYEHSLEAPVVIGGVLFGTINFARDISRDPFSERDLVATGSVARHLGAAIERAVRHEHMYGHAANAVDRLPYPVIVTNDDGTVAFQNRAARKASGSGVDRGDARRESTGLSQAIAEATTKFAADGARVAARTVSVATGQEAVAKTFRLREHGCASVTIAFDRGGTPQSQRLPAWEVLTAREQEIAQFVSDGLRTGEIASAAFISENTVKQHLKRIYAKTGVRNRAELIQLIWASARDAG
jgi:DNA-binding CsgD family transcriptional regulator